MDKVALISMFFSFVMSNDVLQFEQTHKTEVTWTPPKFCNDLECPKFTVLKTTKEYELRQYAQSDWVYTDLQNIEYKGATYEMFMRLFGYISGANTEKKKIPMTCPVINRIIPGQGPACESNFRMSFYIASDQMPAPQPTNVNVSLSTSVPEFTVYVRQFGGFTNDFSAWQKEAVALGEALKKDGLSDFETDYYWTAGYDAPFKLFNRHNEIWFMKKK